MKMDIFSMMKLFHKILKLLYLTPHKVVTHVRRGVTKCIICNRLSVIRNKSVFPTGCRVCVRNSLLKSTYAESCTVVNFLLGDITRCVVCVFCYLH